MTELNESHNSVIPSTCDLRPQMEQEIPSRSNHRIAPALINNNTDKKEKLKQQANKFANMINANKTLNLEKFHTNPIEVKRLCYIFFLTIEIFSLSD